MLRHETKIPFENGFIWVACEVIGTDESDYIIQYKDLSGNFYESIVSEKSLRQIKADIPDDVLMEAAWLAANHIKEYLILAPGEEIEYLAYEVFNILEQSLNKQG